MILNPFSTIDSGNNGSIKFDTFEYNTEYYLDNKCKAFYVAMYNILSGSSYGITYLESPIYPISLFSVYPNKTHRLGLINVNSSDNSISYVFDYYPSSKSFVLTGTNYKSMDGYCVVQFLE